MADASPDWIKQASIYQTYPLSFKYSPDGEQNDPDKPNGGGYGNLKGITEELGYIADMNMDAVWICPFYESPLAVGFGYNASNYTSVDPTFGTMEHFRELSDTAHENGVKVIIDQVYSHTDISHEWFEKSRNKEPGYEDFYVWHDGDRNNMVVPITETENDILKGRTRPATGEDIETGNAIPGLPNNWQSIWSRDNNAWRWDETREQYYLHSFDQDMPDLNMNSEAVQQALLDVARFWLDAGVDGFRLDAALHYGNDSQFRDNPSLTDVLGITPQEFVAHLNAEERFAEILELPDSNALNDKDYEKLPIDAFTHDLSDEAKAQLTDPDLGNLQELRSILKTMQENIDGQTMNMAVRTTLEQLGDRDPTDNTVVRDDELASIRANLVRGILDEPDSKGQLRIYDIADQSGKDYLAKLSEVAHGYERTITIDDQPHHYSPALLGEINSRDAKGAEYVQAGLVDTVYTRAIDQLAFIEADMNALMERSNDEGVNIAFSNHDKERALTRFFPDAEVENRGDQAKILADLLTSLPGSICVYQGEELGLPNPDIHQIKQPRHDPQGLADEETKGLHDAARAPIPWHAAEGPEDTMWLAVSAEQKALNRDTQVNDADSVLNHYKDAIRFRKDNPLLSAPGSIEFIGGEGYGEIPGNQGEAVIAFVKHDQAGEHHMLCAFNLTDKPAEITLPKTIKSEHPSVDPDTQTLTLEPYCSVREPVAVQMLDAGLETGQLRRRSDTPDLVA